MAADKHSTRLLCARLDRVGRQLATPPANLTSTDRHTRQRLPCRELRGAVVGRDEEVARLRRESEALLSAAAGGGPAPHLQVGSHTARVVKALLS